MTEDEEVRLAKRRDEVVRRMLATPPKPHKKKARAKKHSPPTSD